VLRASGRSRSCRQNFTTPTANAVVRSFSSSGVIEQSSINLQ
jgi:hypothetical protein